MESSLVHFRRDTAEIAVKNAQRIVYCLASGVRDRSTARQAQGELYSSRTRFCGRTDKYSKTLVMCSLDTRKEVSTLMG